MKDLGEEREEKNYRPRPERNKLLEKDRRAGAVRALQIKGGGLSCEQKKA